MAELNWEKTEQARPNAVFVVKKRWQYVAISTALVGVIAYLLVSGTVASGRYFITVKTLLSRPDLAGKTVKITGAVIGETIKNDPNSHQFSFTLANLNDDSALLEEQGGLAKALHLAVIDATAQHLNIVVRNQAMPDLLSNEAQAILTGHLNANGIFEADELLLKCPSRYQSDLPKQSAQNGS